MPEYSQFLTVLRRNLCDLHLPDAERIACLFARFALAISQLNETSQRYGLSEREREARAESEERLKAFAALLGFQVLLSHDPTKPPLCLLLPQQHTSAQPQSYA